MTAEELLHLHDTLVDPGQARAKVLLDQYFPTAAPATATPPDTLPAQPGRTPLEGNMTDDRGASPPDWSQGPPTNWKPPAALGVRTGLTLGGGLAGTAAGGPAGGVVGTMGGGFLANRANQYLGLEEPEVPLTTVGGMPINLGDVLAVASPLVLAGGSAATRAWLNKGPVGTAINEAKAATDAAQATWKQAADKAIAARQTDLYGAAFEEAKAAQADYATKLGKLNTQLAKAQQYDSTLTTQSTALQTAKDIPGKYAPDTPSWSLYEKFGDIAKDAPVDMAHAPGRMTDILARRGTLPTGEPVPIPGQLQPFVEGLQGVDNTISAQQVRNTMRQLGPLTRSPNGAIQGLAKQMYGVYGDALEGSAAQLPETAAAKDLIQAANANWRREMAVQDVADWMQPGPGSAVRYVNGRQAINTDTVLNKIDDKIAHDPEFVRHFATPDEVAALRSGKIELPAALRQMRDDIYMLKGTPKMPTGARPVVPGAPTAPEAMPGAYSGPLAPFEPTPTPPPTVGPRPGDVPPTLTRPPLFTKLGFPEGIAAALAWTFPKTAAALEGAKLAAPQLNYLLGKAMLSDRLRPWALQAMRDGVVPEQLQRVLSAAVTQEGHEVALTQRGPAEAQTP